MPWLSAGSTEPNRFEHDTGDSKTGDNALRGLAYDPTRHAPLLVPTTISGGENFVFDDFLWAIGQAQGGKACVLTFHGVPDTNYPWVDTPAELFTRCMRHLHDHGYQVLCHHAVQLLHLNANFPCSCSLIIGCVWMHGGAGHRTSRPCTLRRAGSTAV
jgi:hypothetical protein